MLSNLASYLLGYNNAERAIENSSDVPPIEEEENLRLTALETEEDDWLLVEKADQLKEEKKVSRSSSSTSLPCLSLEESWFITPPPCFTSTGPVTVETSPMENLLIEHPSMSVYHQRGVGSGGNNFRTPSNTPLPPTTITPPPSPPPTSNYQVHHRHHHPQTVESAQQNLQLQLAASQKQQHHKTTQLFKRNQLDRGNKVRELNGRKKRQCRKDKQKNHSGANNNRKCC